jgi:hypothetical protein
MFAKRPRVAVGIALEGSVLRLVQLERKRDKTLLLTAIRRVSLAGDEAAAEEAPALAAVGTGAQSSEPAGEPSGTSTQGGADPFADQSLGSAFAAGAEADEDETAPVIAAMLGILDGCDLRHVAVNVPDTHVFYHHLEVDPALKSKALRQHVQAALETASGGSASEQAAYLQAGDGSVLALARVGNCPVADAAISAGEFLAKKRRVAVLAAVPDEMAIASLVQRVLPAADAQMHTAVIHIGEDATRVTLMRGGAAVWVAPVIHESARSRTLSRTLVSRILLVQDEAGIRQVDRMVLTGAAEWVEAADWLRPEFPDSEISYLPLGEVQVAEDAKTDVIEQFAVSIALAWDLLEPLPAGQRGDLLPPELAELNRRGLAWHGVALTLASGIGAGLVTLAAIGLYRAEMQARQELVRVQEEIALVEEAALRSMEMASEADDLERGLARLQRLATSRYLWSSFLTSASTQFRQVGGCWVNVLADAKGGMELQGMTVRRPRLPDLAERLGDVVLRSATELRVRTRPIYRFELVSGPGVEKEIAASRALEAALSSAKPEAEGGGRKPPPASDGQAAGKDPPTMPPGHGPGGSTDA